MVDLMFILAHGSLILICVLLVIIIKSKIRNALRKCFIFYLICQFIWTLGILGVYYSSSLGLTEYIVPFDNLSYFGVSFIAVALLLLGRTFCIEKKYTFNSISPLFIIPIITQVIIWTNPLHHFFFGDYDYNITGGIDVGWYFYIHIVYSYGCILVGLYYLGRFALQSKGNSSIQAVVILVGTIIPIVINVLFSFNIGNFSVISTPVAFMLTTLTYLFGFYRYNLFRVTPIALRTIVNSISDLYIVLDEEMNVLDYNEPFHVVFSPLIKIKENGNLKNIMSKTNKTGISFETLLKEINKCKETCSVNKTEYELRVGDDLYDYSVEFTPLVVEDKYRGCIILLKDITRAVNDMKEIEQNHKILIEK
jgi:hypothetical protein